MAWNHGDESIGLIESQRILSVIEDAVERLAFLGRYVVLYFFENIEIE